MCKSCKGTGKLPMKKFEGLFDIVKQELSKFLESSMREAFEKRAQEFKIDSESVSTNENHITLVYQPTQNYRKLNV